MKIKFQSTDLFFVYMITSVFFGLQLVNKMWVTILFGGSFYGAMIFIFVDMYKNRKNKVTEKSKTQKK